MIVKQIYQPISLVQHEVLLKRFSGAIELLELIQLQHKRLLTGYKGEKNLEFFLSEWQRDDAKVLFDLKISDIQLDVFLLCKNYGVILEVKNFYGKLYFDQKHQQMVRSTSSGEQGFLYPIAQLNRQKRLLKNWLEENGLSGLPLYGFVVIANSSTIIQSDKSLNHVIHAHSLLEKLEILDRIHEQSVLQTRQLNRWTQRLLDADQIKLDCILSKYNLNVNSFRRGVECSNCHGFSMERLNRTWECVECGHTDKNAHLRAIAEYLLLNGKKTITNGEFREWTGLKSKHSANKILHRSNFLPVGTHKSRKYVAPDTFLLSYCQK